MVYERCAWAINHLGQHAPGMGLVCQRCGLDTGLFRYDGTVIAHASLAQLRYFYADAEKLMLCHWTPILVAAIARMDRIERETPGGGPVDVLPVYKFHFFAPTGAAPCKFKGCRIAVASQTAPHIGPMSILGVTQERYTAVTARFCAAHAATALALESNSAGLKVDGPPATCSVGADWED